MKTGLFMTAIVIAALIAPAGSGFAAAAQPHRNFSQGNEAESGDRETRPETKINAAQQWLAYYRASQTGAGVSSISYDQIRKFILAHPDFPAMGRLAALTERAMPRGISEADLLAWFGDHPPQTAFGMRSYAGALGDSGQGAKVAQIVGAWWIAANLDPLEQGSAYIDFAPMLSKTANEARLRRLIYKGQYKNARMLADVMGRGYVALTEARIALRLGTGNVNDRLRNVPAALLADEGLMFDRLQWRRETNDDRGAIDILNRAPPADGMYDPDAWGKERGIIARRLFEGGDYRGAYDLSMDHGTDSGAGFAGNEWMAGWLSLEFLGQPWQAFEHFERLYHVVETPISRSRAAYWAGLASERLNHPEVAAKWFTVAAKYPTTFYGQLSRDRLGRHDPIRDVPVSGSAAFKSGSLATAARWLKANGYKTEAGLFLSKMTDLAETSHDYAGVAETASALSMKSYAIKAAQECEKTTGVSLVKYAFPNIEKYMGDSGAEWALVHALVRQESRYDDQAVSGAGALGLMQLMPGTASEMARKANLSHQTGWLTSRPEHNVELGSLYLERLLARYDGNYAMALAAYNAGPMRVNRWLPELGDPRDPKVDLVNWIEMIPIAETRNYVQRVLESLYVYRQILPRNRNEPPKGSAFAAR